MSDLKKARVTLHGVELAATQPVVWKLQTGTTPYVTALTVHKSRWPTLEARGADYGDLVIEDARGVTTRIKDVSIMHQIASDSPNRVSFLVADKRWKWPYKQIIREYNVTRKSGDRELLQNGGVGLGNENPAFRDVFTHRAQTLNNGKLWTAQEAVEDVLEKITSEEGRGVRSRRYVIEGFPIVSGEGQLTLQNVFLKDSADIALARLLSYIPGAEVYIDVDGAVRVIDAADYSAAEQFFEDLPPATWDGDAAAFINRDKIRPGAVKVFYQREVECVFEFEDDYGPTSSTGNLEKDAPYLINVIPTVDNLTEISTYNPETQSYDTKLVRQGTYVPIKDWLVAMDEDRPIGSDGRTLGEPWTWATIEHAWVSGQLDQLWGGGGGNEFDMLETGNLSARISAFKRHFRQTFQVNPAYMDRVRDLLNVRVQVIDPVQGTRAPSLVWNQYCIMPTTKGIRMAPRTKSLDPHETQGIKRNVDALYRHFNGEQLVDTPSGAFEVVILDRDLGVFRVEGLLSPYGSQESITPCHIVDASNGGTPRVPTRDLSRQDRKPIGPGFRVEGQTAGVYLRKTMRLKALLTVVPASPNNERQCHAEEVLIGDIDKLFQSEFRIQSGKGPDLEIFVPPGEVTARFAWKTDEEAVETIADLLGINDSPGDPDSGIDGPDLPGYEFTNETSEVRPHAIAIAAEMLAPFADNLQGRVVTRAGRGDLRLRGNMESASIEVSAAPSAKVRSSYEFPGQAKSISRLALLPDAARKLILGIVPFRGDSK